MNRHLDTTDRKQKTLLLTGASGMLGHYMSEVFHDYRITTLGQGDEADIPCDLSVATPRLPDDRFDIVVHCAGSRDEQRARQDNTESTRNLLRSLHDNSPGAFILVSTTEVYGRSEGENIDETAATFPTSNFGSSKLDAERLSEAAFKDTPTVLTVLRAAPMFGAGLSGWAQRMFADVLAGRYVHLRGNDSRLSVVTALDVARAAKALHPIGGTFNVADGKNPTWLELAEAMSANAGRFHRMATLPPAWAKILSRPLSLLPSLCPSLSRQEMERRARTLTFSSDRLREISGLKLYDTIEVIARRDPDYPYEDQ